MPLDRWEDAEELVRVTAEVDMDDGSAPHGMLLLGSGSEPVLAVRVREAPRRELTRVLAELLVLTQSLAATRALLSLRPPTLRAAPPGAPGRLLLLQAERVADGLIDDRRLLRYRRRGRRGKVSWRPENMPKWLSGIAGIIADELGSCVAEPCAPVADDLRLVLLTLTAKGHRVNAPTADPSPRPRRPARTLMVGAARLPSQAVGARKRLAPARRRLLRTPTRGPWETCSVRGRSPDSKRPRCPA